MCRAFRKPSPSHRQGFEPWCSSSSSQPHYFRDQQSYARPLSIADILNETHHVLHPAAEGTSFSLPFSSEQQQFLPNQTVMDKQLLIELPQLDSPTAPLSASLAIKECNQQHHNINGLTNEEYCSDEIRSNINSGGQGGIDWKSLDNLFASQMTDSAYNLSHPMMIPHSIHDIQAQNQDSHILGCFPDS